MTLKLFEQLSQDFTQLLESKFDYNVVIEVGERPNIQLFEGHSVVLYQRSLYFRQKLIDAIKKENIIEIKLPNISGKSFNIIIKYIYGGTVSLENLEAPAIFDLLIATNELKITEFAEYLQSHLINKHASWIRLNISRVYQASFLNEKFEPLQQFCINILAKYPNIIFNSDNFTTLQENALIALLKNDDLKMEESEIWDKVILWGKAKTPSLSFNLNSWTDESFKSLKATLQHCLPHIRYFQISSKDALKKIRPYRNILEENVWDDIVARFLDPDVSITSRILSPRKKETVQCVPRKVFVIKPSSSIITLQHAAEISSWIDRSSTIYDITEIPYEFKLLYRGSRDGFSGEAFHKLCDNIPGTVVVAKVNSTNEILGGYNPHIWKVSNSLEYATTVDSFIFSLKNEDMNQSILSRVYNSSRSIVYEGKLRGPWFGGGDFGMGDGLINPKKWCCRKQSYSKPIAKTIGWFIIDEYEVFQICY
ncbi:hypothetical protein C2G38_2245001 [Gigaspora rosea]|uniref:TLD-domain-containing protein n=1 Tax=Gigaspora rosea TaxID=44941 RepID=A0A397VFH3_9GLOM|nr:hypothetical protein C2G38_2245001 [Gigaspora rosea]